VLEIPGHGRVDALLAGLGAQRVERTDTALTVSSTTRRAAAGRSGEART
jgi:hypothetical protein